MPIQLFLLKYNLALWRCQFTVWESSPCCPSIFRGNLSYVLGWFQDFLCFDVLQFMYSWSSCKFPFLKFFFNTCSDFSICIFINFQKSSTMISLNVVSPFFKNCFKIKKFFYILLKFFLDMHWVFTFYFPCLITSLYYPLSLCISVLYLGIFLRSSCHFTNYLFNCTKSNL